MTYIGNESLQDLSKDGYWNVEHLYEDDSEKEWVNHPDHYNKHPSGVECIDIIRHMSYNIGAVMKYLWRAGIKDPDKEIEDLKKAKFYLEDEIKRLERMHGELTPCSLSIRTTGNRKRNVYAAKTALRSQLWSRA